MQDPTPSTYIPIFLWSGIGTVVAHGLNVTSPSLDTPVGIKYSASACLSCTNCLQGGETTCASPAEAQISGYTCPGTFQQYVLAPANYVTPIPATLPDLAAAAPLMCGGVSVYTALKRAGVKQGDWVVISGAGGGLGHLAVQYARVMGARVLGVDSGAGKETLVKGLGAEEFVDFMTFKGDDAALAARVKEITGGGAQIVLMCAASAKAYASGLLWLGFRGRLCCLGIPEPEAEPALHAVIIALLNLELTIMGKSCAEYWKGVLVRSSCGTMADTDGGLASATKSGNRLDTIETVDIAARHGIKTQYELRKMEDLTQVGLGFVSISERAEKGTNQLPNYHRFSKTWKLARSTVVLCLTSGSARGKRQKPILTHTRTYQDL